MGLKKLFRKFSGWSRKMLLLLPKKQTSSIMLGLGPLPPGAPAPLPPPAPPSSSPAPNDTDYSNQGDDESSTSTYQQAPTMFFVIAGMASMLFLIIVAIALLCYSHYMNHYHYRLQNNESSAGLNSSSADDNGGGGASPDDQDDFNNSVRSSRDHDDDADDDVVHQFETMILVRVPGTQEPMYFAHPAPLPPDLKSSCLSSASASNMQEEAGAARSSNMDDTRPFSTPISETGDILELQHLVGMQQQQLKLVPINLSQVVVELGKTHETTSLED